MQSWEDMHRIHLHYQIKEGSNTPLGPPSPTFSSFFPLHFLHQLTFLQEFFIIPSVRIVAFATREEMAAIDYVLFRICCQCPLTLAWLPTLLWFIGVHNMHQLISELCLPLNPFLYYHHPQEDSRRQNLFLFFTGSPKHKGSM